MAKKVTGYLKLQVPAGGGQSVAADRSRARPARPQHHGVLQGVQRADPEAGEGRADPGRHHDLRGPLLHLRDEDAAGVALHQEGGEARKRLEDARAATRPARSPRRRSRKSPSRR